MKRDLAREKEKRCYPWMRSEEGSKHTAPGKTSKKRRRRRTKGVKTKQYKKLNLQ